jgi:APA family basic amino acid/polyamine antiporter
VNIGTLAAFTIVAPVVIVLRQANPHRAWPFRCPLMPYVPAACILSRGHLITALPILTHQRP